MDNKSTLFIVGHCSEDEKKSFLDQHIPYQQGRWIFIFSHMAFAREFYDSLPPVANTEVTLLDQVNRKSNLSSLANSAAFVLLASLDAYPPNLSSLAQSLDPRPIIVFMNFNTPYPVTGRPCSHYAWEIFLEMCQLQTQLICLWKNGKSDFPWEFRRELLLGLDEVFYLDIGKVPTPAPSRRQLYFYPTLRWTSWGTSLWKRRLRWEMQNCLEGDSPGTLYCFFQTGKEVAYWLRKYSKFSNFIIGYSGGSLEEFYQKLKVHSRPRCILATPFICGLMNLPQARRVFISTPLHHREFWNQIVGRFHRGGQGPDCEFYSFNALGTTGTGLLRDVLSRLWEDACLRFLEFFFMGPEEMTDENKS